MSSLMDKSLTAPQVSSSPRAAWLVVGLISLVVLAAALFGLISFDPYVNEVLALKGNLDRGQAIFQANCAVCHGIHGDGYIGPSLWGVSQRKSKAHLIEQVVSGQTPPMPQFQPTPQEMADLLDYLQTF